MMLGIASLSVMVSCNKETGVTPENAQVQENQNEIKNFKSDEYLTFDKVKMMLEGKGTLKKAPAGYNSVYPPSERYDICLFTETLTGKIHEIYVYKDWESYLGSTSLREVCDKNYCEDENGVECTGTGNTCRIERTNGGVLIVICAPSV